MNKFVSFNVEEIGTTKVAAFFSVPIDSLMVSTQVLAGKQIFEAMLLPLGVRFRITESAYKHITLEMDKHGRSKC